MEHGPSQNFPKIEKSVFNIQEKAVKKRKGLSAPFKEVCCPLLRVSIG